MNKTAFLFFSTAIVYALLGMAMGIYMAASQDHALSPAHAHLNLLGWVSMALYGLYYHTVPLAAESRLAMVHFVTSTLGVWLLIPGIVLALEQVTEALAITGSFVTIASMALFLFIVFKSRTAAAR